LIFIDITSSLLEKEQVMNNHPRFKYLFLGLDVMILTFAFFVALAHCIPGFWQVAEHNSYFYVSHATFYVVSLSITIFTFKYNNLYKRNIVILRYRHFILIQKSLIVSGIIIVGVMLFLNLEYLIAFGKNQVIEYILVSSVLFTVFRAFLARSVYKLLAYSELLTINILIVGGDRAGKEALKTLSKDSFSDFQVSGFVDDYKPKGAPLFNEYCNLGRLEDLEEVIQTNKVDEILIAIDNAPYSRLIHIVETCMHSGKSVRIYSNLLKVIADRLDIEYYASIPLVSLTPSLPKKNEMQDKRLLDITLSTLALLLLSPLFLIIAVAIKMSSRGPVFYKQQRIGRNGEPFDFYKFRSMHVSNDESGHKQFVTDFIKGNNSSQSSELPVFKIADDPRIFPFGKFIRKTSLDEFPQFYNVLKGDMSLVGPRPCLPYEWDCYEKWHKKRLDIIPGCTGIWQALGRSSVTFEEMVVLDLYYISNLSMWLDFKVIVKTIPVIFFGKGGF
jgi:exopolysaccharide biosynthesis polyprenyl glycosylphosphotransferase